MVLQAGALSATPPAPQKLKIGTQGSHRLSLASLIWVGLHGWTPQENQIRVVAGGSPMLRALTPTSTSNFGGGCGLFYRKGLQAPSKPASSAMGRDPGITERKKTLVAPQKKTEREAKTAETELWKVEGTHFSLG
ncbi:hypothetical protein E2C01_057017 [Portunus trituberculatus]|uniref:Uncharacterized protein n=1 Tax=Portunus trituberculatus TaxID=210409 RepID=A0A5B7GZ79_PORTR|nr:hypothetical protein [Portunus trituberculatus]